MRARAWSAWPIPTTSWSAGRVRRAAPRPLIDADLARDGVGAGRGRHRAVPAGGAGAAGRAGAAATRRCGRAWRSARRREGAGRAARGAGPAGSRGGRAPSTRGTRAGCVRALEAVAGRGHRQWSGRDDLWDPRYDHPTLVVGLTLERAELYRRASTRGRAGWSPEGRWRRCGAFREDARAGGARAPGGAGHPERHRLSRRSAAISTASSTREEAVEPDGGGHPALRPAPAHLAAEARGTLLSLTSKTGSPADIAARDRWPSARPQSGARRIRREEPRTAMKLRQVAGTGQRLPGRRGVGASRRLSPPRPIGLLCDRHLRRGLRRHPAARAAHRARCPARSPACASSTPTAASRRCAATASASSPATCAARGAVAADGVRRRDAGRSHHARGCSPDGRVRVDMGRARFRERQHRHCAWPAHGRPTRWSTQCSRPLGARYRFTFVDVGNPHCVIVVDDPARPAAGRPSGRPSSGIRSSPTG